MGPTAVKPQPSEPREFDIIPAKPEPVLQMAPPTPTTVLLQAYERGANAETMLKLLEVQERWEANQSRKAFDVAFAAFKAEAPRLERTKEVSFGSNKTAYKYTPLDQIANTLAPILSKHGLSYNWKQDTKEGITVTCILRHTQGYSIENTLNAQADPSGSKNAIQAIGSAVSYLRRYTLLGALGMATSDEDTDAVTMMEAADFVTKIQESKTLAELATNYKEAVADALRKQSAKAAGVYMEARKKREAELRA